MISLPCLLYTSDPAFPWLPIILGYPIMGVWFWCTDQSMVQPVLAAKNLKEMCIRDQGVDFTEEVEADLAMCIQSFSIIVQFAGDA